MATDGDRWPAGRRASTANWVIAISLSVVAACLLVELGGGVSHAQPIAPAVGTAQSGSVMAVAGQVSPGTYGVYLIDTKAGRMCVYQWLPSPRKLRLMAARNYTFDLKLDDFNNHEPRPAEVKEMLKGAKPLN